MIGRVGRETYDVHAELVPDFLDALVEPICALARRRCVSAARAHVTVVRVHDECGGGGGGGSW